jgi:hypothetical protein
VTSPTNEGDINTTNGYVALLDVLGFRELVSRTDKEALLRTYIGIVRRVLHRPNIEFVLFSDTIVINTSGESEHALANIVLACSNLLYELSLTNIAVRGAVSYGPFVKSGPSGQGVFVAGKPIVEAYHFETQQDWVGIMLAPSVRQTVADLATQSALREWNSFSNGHDFISNNALAIHLYHNQNIPFHDDEDYDGYVVVPVRALPTTKDHVLESIKRVSAQLGNMKAVAPDPIAQRKYGRTIDMLDRFVLNRLDMGFGRLD